jgi:purine-nucleoside phosphorylase
VLNLDDIASRIPGPVEVALILGSGLGPFADTIENAQVVATRDVPGYPQSTVAGHAGKIVVGTVGETRVMAFQGRVHMYEGHSPEAVTIPVQLAQRKGAKILLVTNASGSFSIRFAPGDLLLIEDHINLQFRNPLISHWQSGLRCPDVSGFYDDALMEFAERAAMELHIPLKRGTLAALTGPTYETPAEARMLAKLGAAAGCMSTIPEVLMAKALGLRTLGISCITNFSAILPGSILNHDDVQAVAKATAGRFQALLRSLLLRIKEQG